uniref:Uncharacterized protein n=1 Tax=viral metagenome TaxID=1070528 RepID=A0A6M3L5Q4_9ZZZZ
MATITELLSQRHLGDLPVVNVSWEAVEEVANNWDEIHGWAYGQAYVEHPDWVNAYNRAKSIGGFTGNCVQVIATAPNGQAWVRSISWFGRFAVCG